MKRKRAAGSLPIAVAIVSFGAGAAVDAVLRTYGPPKPAIHEEARIEPAARSVAANRKTAPVATAGDIPRARLRVPIDGSNVEMFKGGFAEPRAGHPHEAVDILAPRNTPVHAVEDGTIAKLFFSRGGGGNTIYEFDPDGRYAFYYAHLQRYADGLHEGGAVKEGQVIGYVGTSGNAPPDTPHLHFAVFELNADRHWWQGRAVDPYPFFK